MKTVSLRQFNREVRDLAEPVQIILSSNGEFRTLGHFYPGPVLPLTLGIEGVWPKGIIGDEGWAIPDESSKITSTPGKLPGPDGPRITPGLAPRSQSDPGAQERFGAPRPAPKERRAK